ncbi:hypothetical protein TRIUR3_10503 [Triticum urartu]|uniref:Uncharacterized protein n=1 Tax=Triticum urartu TaxID=4572 RepID=M7ZJC2_TRIUA|nr:hypothetical protein TRIUR3_10503 [Triticum urartu]
MTDTRPCALLPELIVFACADFDYVRLQGSQFCTGYGGIGGILRYRVEVNAYEDILDKEYDEDFEDQSTETPVNSVQEEHVLARNRNALRATAGG